MHTVKDVDRFLIVSTLLKALLKLHFFFSFYSIFYRKNGSIMKQC